MDSESEDALPPAPNAPARAFCVECAAAHEVLRQTDAASTDTERPEILQLF